MKRSFRIALVYVTLVALMFSMFGGAVTADGGTATGAPVPGDAVSGIPSEDEDAPDTEAPAAPAGLHVAGTTSTSVSLSWNAPDPNSGTVTYAVYNGGASAGTTDHTQFVVTGLLPSTSYVFSVAALDAAGRTSPASGAVEAVTEADGSADSTGVKVVTPAAADTGPGIILARDSFESAVGVLHGAGGGKGWSKGWEVQNGNADEPGYNVRGDNPLVYDGLYQTGSYAIGGKAYLTAVRGLSLSADGPFAAYLENGKIGKPGTALWISALMRKDNMTDSSLAIGTDWPSTKLETGFFGSESTDNNIRYWSLKVNGTVYRSAVPLEVGKAALLVMKLELGAENRISLYVNPAEPGGDAPAAPDVQAATDANLGFGMISTTSASGGTEDYSIDEIRIGTTFGAVTPAFFDNEAPSAPAGVEVVKKTDSAVTLGWEPAADNVGVVGYDVFQGGTPAGTTSGTTFTVKGLTRGTGYTFTVKARDAEGNISPASEPVEVTTDAQPADNSLYNFENEDLQGMRLLDGQNAAIALDGTHTFAGEGAAKITLSGGGTAQTIGWDVPDPRIKPGKTVSFRFYVPSGQDDIVIQPMVFGAGWAYNGGFYETKNLEKDKWITLDVKFETGDVPSPRVGIAFTANAPAVVWMDSITFNGYGEADTEAPTVPGNLRATSATDNVVSLAWTASTDNEDTTVGYVIYKGDEAAGTTTGAASFTVAGLDASTPYTFTVRAKDTAGNLSEPSNGVLITTDAAHMKLSGTPYGSASRGDSGTVSFDKAFDGSADSYFDAAAANGSYAGLDLGEGTAKRVTKLKFHPRKDYPDRMTGGKFQGSLTRDGGYTTILTIRGVPEDGWNEVEISDPHGFRFLRYLGPDGSSANVAELEFYGIEGDIAAPSAPASLQVAGVTETTVSLSWSPSTDNDTVTGYTVYADGKAAGTTADTSFTVRGLEPDRSYVFTVTAKDSVNNISAPSGPVEAMTPPAAVVLETTVNNTNGKVVVRGEVSSGANQEVTVDVKDSEGRLVFADQVTSGFGGTFLLTFTIDGDGTYTVTAGGLGVAEPYASVIIIGEPGEDTAPPAAPAGLAAVSATARSIALEWQAAADNTGVTGYVIYQNGEQAGITADTHAAVTGLEPATTYTFTVKAKDAAGNLSAASNALQATTEPAPAQGLVMEVTPSKDIVEHGEGFDLVISAMEVSGLYGYDLSVTFDPEAYEIVSIAPTAEFKGNSTPYFNQTVSGGRIRIVSTLLGEPEGRTGDVPLVAITFKAKDVHAKNAFTLKKGSTIADENDQLFALGEDVASYNVIVSADVIGNDGVQINDLTIVAKAFGDPAKYDPKYDMNLDGLIDIYDIAYVADKLLAR